jgi:putative ABC transport system permease protein
VRALDCARYALRGLSERRGRSAGAAVGVAIAVTALSLALGLGEAFQQAFTEYLGRTLAANSVIVMNSAPGLTDADVALFRQLPRVREVFGVATAQAVVAAAGGYRTATVIAVEPAYLPELVGAASLEGFVEEGSPIPGGLGVVVGANLWLDQSTGTRLHGVGEVLSLRVGGREVSVVVAGLARQYGFRTWMSIDDSVFMDPEAFFTYVSGRRVYQAVILLLDDPSAARAVSDEVRALAPPRSNVFSPVAMVAQLGMFVSSLNAFLAFVSLLSIGITALWIFDSTAISVVQRVKEIGILKAVGFSSRDVLAIFLAEAALVSLIGGAAGLAFSLASSRLVSIPLFAIRLTPRLTPQILLTSLLAPLAANVAAAAVPARAAARLDPVKALRYE